MWQANVYHVFDISIQWLYLCTCPKSWTLTSLNRMYVYSTLYNTACNYIFIDCIVCIFPTRLYIKSSQMYDMNRICKVLVIYIVGLNKLYNIVSCSQSV